MTELLTYEQAKKQVENIELSDEIITKVNGIICESIANGQDSADFSMDDAKIPRKYTLVLLKLLEKRGYNARALWGNIRIGFKINKPDDKSKDVSHTSEPQGKSDTCEWLRDLWTKRGNA